MTPGVLDGTISPATLPLPVPVLPVSVTIRGVPARVTYAGVAPGYISGLLQVNIEVPSNIKFGAARFGGRKNQGIPKRDAEAFLCLNCGSYLSLAEYNERQLESASIARARGMPVIPILTALT